MDDKQSDDVKQDANEDDLHNGTTFEHSELQFQAADEASIDADDFGTSDIAPSEVEPTTGDDDSSDTDESAEGVGAVNNDTLDQTDDDQPANNFDSNDETTDVTAGSDMSSPEVDPIDSAEADETTSSSDEMPASEIEPSTTSDQFDAELNHTDEETVPSDITETTTETTDQPAAQSDSGGIDQAVDDMAGSTIATAVVSKKSGWWSKKRTVWAIIAAVIVVLLLASSAFAYKSWYQSPEKVLSDATLNLLSAKSMTFTGALNIDDSSKVDATFSGKTSGSALSAHVDALIDSDGSKLKLPADFVASGDTVYFKSSDISPLKPLFESYLALDGSSLLGDSQMNSLIHDINGTWYKVSSSDLDSTNKDDKSTQCVNKFVSSIRTDKTTQNDIKKVYQEHPLFTLEKELGSKNGSLGYQLKPVSDKAASEFFKGFTSISAYKSLVKCDNSFKHDFTTVGDKADSSTDTATVEVWVSRWDHQFTSIALDGQDGTTKSHFDVKPKVDADATTAVPKDAKTLKDLEAQVERAVIDSLTSSSMNASVRPTVEATVQ